MSDDYNTSYDSGSSGSNDNGSSSNDYGSSSNDYGSSSNDYGSSSNDNATSSNDNTTSYDTPKIEETSAPSSDDSHRNHHHGHHHDHNDTNASENTNDTTTSADVDSVDIGGVSQDDNQSAPASVSAPAPVQQTFHSCARCQVEQPTFIKECVKCHHAFPGYESDWKFKLKLAQLEDYNSRVSDYLPKAHERRNNADNEKRKKCLAMVVCCPCLAIAGMAVLCKAGCNMCCKSELGQISFCETCMLQCTGYGIACCPGKCGKMCCIDMCDSCCYTEMLKMTTPQLKATVELAAALSGPPRMGF